MKKSIVILLVVLLVGCATVRPGIRFGLLGFQLDTGFLYVGMPRTEVLETYGRPTDINASTGSYGTHEQFVYRFPHSTVYIYVENGAVTSWQS